MDLLDSFWVDSFFHAFPLCFHTDRSDRHWWCEVASGNVPAVGNPIWTMTSAPRNASAARVVSHHLTVAPATPATIDTAQWFKHNKNERQVEKPPALLGCNLLRLGQNCEIFGLDLPYVPWFFLIFFFDMFIWSALRQMLVCQQLTWVALAVSHRWQMALIGLWQVLAQSCRCKWLFFLEDLTNYDTFVPWFWKAQGFSQHLFASFYFWPTSTESQVWSPVLSPNEFTARWRNPMVSLASRNLLHCHHLDLRPMNGHGKPHGPGKTSWPVGRVPKLQGMKLNEIDEIIEQMKHWKRP